MFENIPILSIIILFPLVGAFLTLALGNNPRTARGMALVFSVPPMVLSFLLWIAFNPNAISSTAQFQFYENYNWISSIGVSYTVGVDGISIPMVFLTTLLCFLAILYSWDVEERTKEYMGLMLILEVGVLGVFMALDYFLFYVFWEIVLIPMFFLIGIWGGANKAYASIKFFIYTHVASLVMLLGIFALYFATGANTFNMITISQQTGGLDQLLKALIFIALFFGFIVKMPMVPFHTWLPDAHVQAPTAGSVLLAGLLLKMGSYGIIRIILPTLPDMALEFQVVMAVIGVVSIIYGAIICLAQTDLKKMVAYSSISHMGLVMLGIATLGTLGVTAAVFQMFAHGLITAVLFMSVGSLHHHVGTRDIPMLGGIAPKIPTLATLMMVGFLASLGLPGLVGFVAEYSVFTSTYLVWGLWVLIPIASVALTAAYYLWAAQRSLFGNLTTKVDTEHVHDVKWFETVPMGALCVLFIFFGVLPSILMNVIVPSITKILTGAF